MKSKFPLRSICTLLILFALSLQVFAHSGQTENDPSQKKRPRIGLVLSGGGGRGFAHIGALEWLEENRIPIDCIAGTSIGGLVGAMYSIGMSPSEMREFMKKIDWKEALGSGPTYEQLSFRRKEDRRSFQVDIEMGLRDGISLPNGISSAHYIGLMMDRLALAYSGVTNFDHLPIPFRCLATDFIEAKSITLKDGALSSAMRATMSIPGVFPPIERDGKILVDGGLLNNIPTNVAREMGADIVIVVDAGTPLGDLQTIASLTGILQQSITVMTIDNDRRNLRLADIIIAPDIGNHSILDFSSVDKLADLGREAAAQREVLLRNFSLDEPAWQQHLALRRERPKKVIPAPDCLQIAGVGEEAKKRIREKLQRHVGKPLDAEKLESDLTRIIGQGRYLSLDYGLSRSGENPVANTLLITVRRKTHAPPAINVSAEIDGSDVNDINFTIGARLTLFDIDRYGAEWRNDMKVGFRTLFESEYFRPVGDRGVFLAPRAVYRREREFFFLNGARLAEFQTNRAGMGFDIGLAGESSEFRAGYEVGYFKAYPRTGDPLLPRLEGKVDFARLRWAYDGQDSATVPTRGARVTTEGRWYLNAPGASREFAQGEASASVFRPVSDRGTIFFAASAGTTFNQRAAPAQQFTLGGPFRLGAYDRDEFRGSHYGLVTLGYHRRVSELPPLLGGRIYAIGSYDIGGAFDRFNPGQLRNTFSGGLIMDTRLGPFSIITSIGEGGRGKVYFAFGRFF